MLVQVPPRRWLVQAAAVQQQVQDSVAALAAVVRWQWVLAVVAEVVFRQARVVLATLKFQAQARQTLQQPAHR
jgi:hypothetical protein